MVLCLTDVGNCANSSAADDLIQVQYRDEVGLMQSAVTARVKDWTTDKGKVFIFWSAVLFDSLWILMKVVLAIQNLKVDIGCDMIATMLWYAFTVLVLGWVFHDEPDYDKIAEAVNSATQQITSIGYGSSSGSNANERLFHGLNAVASQLGPNNMLSFTYELIRDGLEKTVKTLKGPDNLVTTILLFAASFAAWTLFATDGYNGIDPWYTTLISATTIGYGDQGPQTADHKWMSAFILPLLTTAFGSWSNPIVEEKSVPKRSVSNCMIDLDALKTKVFQDTDTSEEKDKTSEAETPEVPPVPPLPETGTELVEQIKDLTTVGNKKKKL
jgi:hypothetical protein